MGMIQDFQKADKERRSEVVGIRSAVATISDEVVTMLKDLARGSVQRRSEVAATRSEVANMRSSVATMLKELAKEGAERRSAVTSYMRSEVAAIHEMVWGEAPAKKRVVLPKAAPVAVKLPEELPLEGAVAEEAPAGELRDRVFAYLANHPDGVRLTEMEEEFGVARIQIARVIRALIDDNKVEKRNLLYFAV